MSAAEEVGRLAERLYNGCLAHNAAIQAASNPEAVKLAPPRQPGDLGPVARVARADGVATISYAFEVYLEQVRQPELAAEFHQVWISGALITLGDALHRCRYLDRAPELELLRHLRNAAAHGARFNITRPQLLDSHPAYYRIWTATGPTGGPAHWQITPALHGSKLWDFVEPSDGASVLQAVSRHALWLHGTHANFGATSTP
jgi:hypothetical protein